MLILAAEAFAAYFLVLWVHSLSKKHHLTYFYALLGSLTALMSWVTDTGISAEILGTTFLIGSTVFYTALLLGVFVVYVFEGPVAARTAIFTVAGVSVMVPVIAALLHFQTGLAGSEQLLSVPVPSLRINSASAITTVLDLLFLAIAWEFLGKNVLRLTLWSRTFLTLLGIMWLDVLLFNTGAFLGDPSYLSILKGALIGRFVVLLFAFPVLYYYINHQKKQPGIEIENRPVLSIIREVASVRKELTTAREEIELRKKAEQAKEALILELKAALNKVHKLEGLIPICASCRRVRIKSANQQEEDSWISMESYIRKETESELSHGICPECAKVMYPELSGESEQS